VYDSTLGMRTGDYAACQKLYLSMCLERQRRVVFARENGFLQTSGVEPSRTQIPWCMARAAIIPASEQISVQLQIYTGPLSPFYARSCDSGVCLPKYSASAIVTERHFTEIAIPGGASLSM